MLGRKFDFFFFFLNFYWFKIIIIKKIFGLPCTLGSVSVQPNIFFFFFLTLPCLLQSRVNRFGRMNIGFIISIACKTKCLIQVTCTAWYNRPVKFIQANQYTKRPCSPFHCKKKGDTYGGVQEVLKFGFGRDVPPWKMKVDPYQYQFFQEKVTHSNTNLLNLGPNFEPIMAQIQENFEKSTHSYTKSCIF